MNSIPCTCDEVVSYISLITLDNDQLALCIIFACFEEWSGNTMECIYWSVTSYVVKYEKRDHFVQKLIFNYEAT